MISGDNIYFERYNIAVYIHSQSAKGREFEGHISEHIQDWHPPQPGNYFVIDYTIEYTMYMNCFIDIIVLF